MNDTPAPAEQPQAAPELVGRVCPDDYANLCQGSKNDTRCPRMGIFLGANRIGDVHSFCGIHRLYLETGPAAAFWTFL